MTRRGDGLPSRRGVLKAAVGAPLLVACTPPPSPPPPPDPLAELASAARADAATAQAIAASVPALAGPAGAVASVCGEHAVALQREVDRERPPRTSASSASPGPSQAAPATDPATARKMLLDALTAAERRAGELITAVPRYRAGLLGSVAAGCASLREVLT